MKWPFLLVSGALVVAAVLALAYLGPEPMRRSSDTDAYGIHVLARPDRGKIAHFWETFRAACAARDDHHPAHALELFEKALALDPRHEQSLYESANLLLLLHRDQKALDRYRRLFQTHPNKSNRALLQMTVVQSCFEPGAPLNLLEAEKAARQAVERNREESGPFLALARVALARGDLAGARQNLAIVLNLDPKALEAHRLAAIVALRDGNANLALSHARKGIEAFRKDRPTQGVLSDGDIGPGGRGHAPAADVSVAGLMLLQRLASSDLSRSPPLPATTGRGVVRSPTAALDAIAPRPGICAIRLRQGDRPTVLVPRSDGNLCALRYDGHALVACSLPSGIEGPARIGSVVAIDAGSQGKGGGGGPDLVVLGGDWYAPGTTRLLRHRVDGTYEDVTAGSGLGGRTGAFRALVSDVNGDGKQDLILIGIGRSDDGSLPVQVLLGDGRGHFRPGPPVPVPRTDLVCDAVVMDLDGGGRPDLLLVTWAGGLRLLHGHGDGRFEDVTQGSGLDMPMRATSIAVGDLDGDGNVGLVVGQLATPDDVLARQLGIARRAGSPPLVFRRHGTKGHHFERVKDPGLEIACATTSVAVVDLDGDGVPELVLANGALSSDDLEPPVVLAKDHGGHYVDASARFGAWGVTKAWAALVADVDGDGKLDLILPGGGLAPGDRWPGALLMGKGQVALERGGSASTFIQRH